MKNILVLIFMIIATVADAALELKGRDSVDIFSTNYLNVTSSKVGNKRGLDIAFPGPYADAFSRMRVSNPVAIFSSNNIYKLSDELQTRTNGVGASVALTANTSAAKLEVGTVSGEYAIRQSYRYMSYTPGKSQLILMTGVIGNAKANVEQKIGYFDDNNGLFFEQGTDCFGVVVRTDTSGSPVDTKVCQDDWNIDKMDGTDGNSAALDLTKTQIFVIDFQWLGVGRVRFGFDIDGQIKYVHEVYNANTDKTKVYMQQPSLPVRYEIINTGTAASSTSMDEICTSVITEGGSISPGHALSIGASTARSVTTTGPVFAIRLKNTFQSKENRRIVRFLKSNFFVKTKNAYIQIKQHYDPTSVTATWADANAAESGVEYSTDISAVTGGTSYEIEGFYITAGSKGEGIPATGGEGVNNSHYYLAQDYESDNSQLFVVYATNIDGTGNSDIFTALSWLESN